MSLGSSHSKYVERVYELEGILLFSREFDIYTWSCREKLLPFAL